MLGTIFVLLLLTWVVGMLFSVTLGGLLHLLLFAALGIGCVRVLADEGILDLGSEAPEAGPSVSAGDER